MMRLAHLSDLHVTAGARLADHAAVLDAMVTQALALDPHAWLLTGDLFGRTVPHCSTPAERGVLYPQVVRMARHAPVVVLAGNHDEAEDLAGLRHLAGDYPIHVVGGAGTLQVPTTEGILHAYCLSYPTKRWLLAGEGALGLEEAQRAVQEKLGLLLTLWGTKMRRERVKDPSSVHVFAGHLQVGGSRTSGGEVLAGQEIELTRAQLDGLPADYLALGHIHLRQEVGVRAWYPGSPWRNDFGERDRKGWILADVDPPARERDTPYGGDTVSKASRTFYTKNEERHALRLLWVENACRAFVTLDYRWGADSEDATPRWILRPTDAEIAACRDAEVRLRLLVPQPWAPSCPWDAEVERVKVAGAIRVQEERKIEPVLRVRAPEVAAAPSLAEKTRAYWKTLATPPSEAEQRAALAQLALLMEQSDEQIRVDQQALLEAE